MNTSGARAISGCQLYYAADAHSPYGTVIDASGAPIVFTTLPNLGALGGTFDSAATVRPTVNRLDDRRSASFDGVNDAHVSSLAASAWDFLHDKGTVVLLFRTNPVPAAGNLLATSDAELATKVGFMAQYDATQELRFRIGNGSGVWRLNHITTSGVPAGLTHLAILRFDADETTEVDLRIDGAADSTTTLTGTASTAAPAGTATIGAEAGPGAAYFHGNVILAAAFDRYLTIGEVHDIELALRPNVDIERSLPLLGSMPALYMAGWAGNTLVGGRVANAQNVLNPGTYDAPEIAAKGPTNEVAGWSNGSPSWLHNGVDMYLAPDTLAPLVTGTDVPFTYVAARKHITLTNTDIEFSFGSAGAVSYHVIEVNPVLNFRIVRKDNAAFSKIRVGAAMGTAEEVVCMSFDGQNVTTMRNRVVDINNGDLDVGATLLERCGIGAIRVGAGAAQYANVRFGLIGFYDEALTVPSMQAVTDVIATKWPY